MTHLLLLLFLHGAPQARAQPLPDFNLTAVTTEGAKPLSKKDLAGKVWIANFMFTRCHGPCPANSAKMGVLQKRLPKEILLASFTVDPQYDQTQALRAYARRFRARPDRWMFLTAPDEATLIPLFKDAFHTAYKPNPKAACGYETYHSAKFFLIDGQGAIRGEYASEDPEQMRRLESAAKTLGETNGKRPRL